MREFLSKYSDKHNDMNEDIIRGIRLKDNMIEKIEEACIEMAKSLSDCVTYEGVQFDDNKNSFRDSNVSSKKKDSKTGKFEHVTYINVNYTYSRMAVFNFKIKFKDPRTGQVTIQKVKMPIYIPQFVDDYHYYIRGNRYNSCWQLLDGATYRGRDDSVVLKTLTRAIKLSRHATSIVDMHGAEFKTHMFNIHVSSKKIPFLLYYFAWYGFQNTIAYFGCDKYVHLYLDCPIEPDDNIIFFKFGKQYLGVKRDAFNMYFELRQFVATILALGRKNLEMEHIRDVFYWRMILGSYISQSNTFANGANLLTTFVTSLDARTMYILRKISTGSEKRDAFAVLRWMFLTYSTLVNKNMNLTNKRLRYTEYLVVPLVREMQAKYYRWLKTRPKLRDIKRLIDIFKPSPAIITNAIIGKAKDKRQMLNITKYSSQVNDLVLLNSALKFSKSGPNSPVEFSTAKRVGSTFRQMDSSYLGRIDLITSSSSNVGLSGVLTPFCEVNEEIMTFK